MFYIVNKISQLARLELGNKCFIHVVPYNYNYHPVLQKKQISLIYVKSHGNKKGYIIVVKHNESEGIDLIKVIDKIKQFHVNEFWVLNKKNALHYLSDLIEFKGFGNLIDVNFLSDEMPFINDLITNNCIKHYYEKYPNYQEINCLIPISKHYEILESLADKVLYHWDITPMTSGFHYRNDLIPKIFYQIESNGIKVDKNKFIEHFSNNIKYPEFNIYKSKIYTQYNLYTTTSRPSNHFNGINFAALSKTNGERETFIPEYDEFIEFDYSGYHPQILAKLIGYEFQEENIYEHLSKIMNLTIEETKLNVFQQLYGGISKENLKYSYFKKAQEYTEKLYNELTTYKNLFALTRNYHNDKDLTPNKLLNYYIQSRETATNSDTINNILVYLKGNKLQTKLVLYTYDSFLFDFKHGEEEALEDISKIFKFPFKIKRGPNYGCLTKTDNIYA
jgi:hypothetical protein